MKRTPMEMSCWRGRDRTSKLRLWSVMRGDILFGRRGMGHRVRVEYKKMIKEISEYNKTMAGLVRGVRSIGKQEKSVSMQWIRKTYGVPAKRGMRVLYTGEGIEQYGHITSARGGYIRIRLDGEKHTGNYHPRWELVFNPSELDVIDHPAPPTIETT